MEKMEKEMRKRDKGTGKTRGRDGEARESNGEGGRQGWRSRRK